MSHTPGPWVPFQNVGAYSDDYNSGLGWDIVGPKAPRLAGRFVSAADAYLVASAPDLLEALEHVIDDMLDGHCVCEAIKQQVIAAVAKARSAA